MRRRRAGTIVVFDPRPKTTTEIALNAQSILPVGLWIEEHYALNYWMLAQCLPLAARHECGLCQGGILMTSGSIMLLDLSHIREKGMKTFADVEESFIHSDRNHDSLLLQQPSHYIRPSPSLNAKRIPPSEANLPSRQPICQAHSSHYRPCHPSPRD